VLFLGLDGGGTGCRAVVGDAARVLGRGEGGPANPRAVGVEAAWGNALEAVDRALAAAGLGPGAKRDLHACFGLAGVGRPLDHSAFLAVPHPFRSLRLETDVHVALVGALGREEGALLVAGTGSIAYAVDATGGRYRVGGWGLPVGDEGGGAWLGREAVRAALRAYDGRGPRTPLTDRVMERHGGVEGLLAWVLTATPKDFGALAPLVLGAAEDAVGQALRRTAIFHLEELVGALDRRVPPGPAAFSAVGGVAAALLPDLLPRLPVRFWEGYGGPQGPPEEGALRLAQGLVSASSS